VRERVGAPLERHAHLVVGEQRARERRAEQVLVLVDGAGRERLVAVVAYELLTQVLDDALRGARLERLRLDRVVVVALADVAAVGDHLRAVVVLLDPRDDDRRVEAPRVGQHHLLDRAHL